MGYYLFTHKIWKQLFLVEAGDLPHAISIAFANRGHPLEYIGEVIMDTKLEGLTIYREGKNYGY